MRRAGASLAGALAVALLAHGPAAARTPLFWGAGAKTCTDWNDERGLSSRTSAGMRGWVLGMVSGYNIGRAQTGLGDAMDGATTDALWAGIDDFCGAHPDEKIWIAAFAVLQDFDARRPPPPPPPEVTPAPDAAHGPDQPPAGDTPPAQPAPPAPSGA